MKRLACAVLMMTCACASKTEGNNASSSETEARIGTLAAAGCSMATRCGVLISAYDPSDITGGPVTEAWCQANADALIEATRASYVASSTQLQVDDCVSQLSYVGCNMVCGVPYNPEECNQVQPSPTQMVQCSSAEAALTTTIQQTSNGSCSNTRPPLSIGEASTELASGSPGDGRVVNGMGGAVSCTVSLGGAGFSIEARIDAPTLEVDAYNQPYQQIATLNADYPGVAPGLAATANITSVDTLTQTNRVDDACALNVISFGSADGGALFATFECDNFEDENTPGTTCRLTGTIVLENCEK